MVWEASDRICGKRLKAALPSMVESLERHGHLDLDPGVRRCLFSASAATIDRLLRPIREQAGSRRKRKQKRKMGSRIQVRTFSDWKEPEPGYLEIDLVARCGGTVTGSYISSLVVTDMCSGLTEAIPLLAREQSLVVGLEAVSCVCCCSAIPSVLTAKRKCPHYGECDIDAARAGKTSDTQQLTGWIYDDGAGSDTDGSERTPHQAHASGLQRGWSSRTSSR